MVRFKGQPRLEGSCTQEQEWYERVHSHDIQVPAIAYGGPKVDPTNPSPESVKIAESLILLEFIADLFPSANLYTNNPVERAQIRSFIDRFSNQFLSPWYAFLRGNAEDGGRAILGGQLHPSVYKGQE